MEAAGPEQALRHPTWSMGAKISIDSATMFNKGLEVIEAARLFGCRRTRIEVLVHPQSIVHGLVHFRDGSVVAQLGAPDMRIPIAHCLAWPERIATSSPRLDLARDRHAGVRGARRRCGSRRCAWRARHCARAAARPRS